MTSKVTQIFEFMKLIGQLKRTQRTGWVLRGVPRPESVADHMYRMAALAFLAKTDASLCHDKCIKLCLVHDMAECIVGDLTPADDVPKEEKHEREKNAMMHIRDLVGMETGEELFTLWQEYENQETSEAKYVKDLDKFDMILQAHEYEEMENCPGKLQEFFDSTQGKFQHPTVQGWVQELENQRCSTAENTELDS
ncbi:hypothetical protein CAPTEDRAFT_182533 [Capitella teleta]|uniref:5'-deoxynucleotidase HDDC2 n=1 Tax=Capitella teleta TaxID=283909 RepID=R7US64_CAPTE|nr:hypothetical protein CAPTEDRAFT_182533 [Capitella teleta]|eukprot:ELU08978.1 hypothetical protein CAPTEDRAFT_182533 [Capitella teleta]